MEQINKEQEEIKEKNRERINKIFNNNFKVGELIINPNVGIICKVIRICERGYVYAIPMVWKDLYIDPLARESCLNPLYFRKITERDFRLFQERGVLKGHPERCVT